jgi:polysaccharide pyruvyl transferase WcaK-like protein
VDVLSVRDRKSYDTCLGLGLSPDRVQLVPDAVFVTPPAVFTASSENGAVDHPAPRQRDGAEENGSRLRVALNLNYDIENPANWPIFLQNLEDGLRALHSSQPLEIHTLPMQSGFKYENDWKVLAEFRERIPDIDVHMHRPETFREAAAIIANCDVLFSERLHALVMAAILGKPFLALMYDVKVSELIAGLDMMAYALDINAPFDPLAFKNMAETVLRDSEAVREHLLERSAALRQELDAYFRALGQRFDPET